MKSKFEDLGVALSKEQAKQVTGGKPPRGCLEDYTYDCVNCEDCCSQNCETNGTGTGTLCMP